MAIVAMIVPLALHAQEDVTATYLLNPSFEEGDEAAWFHDSTKVVVGWDISKKDLLISYRNQDHDGTQDGSWIFGTWDPSNIGDFQISQTVKNLPAGTYVISCLMTVPNGNNTTQRLFASTSLSGTKSKIFASSILNNVTIPGEEVSFAGLVVDGVGNGPFKPMELRIKVAQGDSLVIGIRSNGQKSTVFPYSAIGGIGELKIDKFQLGYLSDEGQYNKDQIKKSIDVIKLVPTDSIPGGYATIIETLITEAEGVITNENNLDSLEAYNVKMEDFIATLKSARTTFYKLMGLMMKAEDVMQTTELSGEELLQNAFDSAFIVFNSFESLIPDFEAAYTSLNAIYVAHIDGRIEENLALIATASTSYVSDWEKLSAINDGFEPVNSVDRPNPVYGNWNGDPDYGKTNWVQYEWPYFHNIKEISVYWFHDFGGLSQPNATNVEYWENSAWKTISPIDTLLNQWNTLKVDIKTNKLRLSFSSPTSTGIVEFKVMGFEKKTYDVEDFKAMIRGEITAVSVINQDSIPKGYSPLTTTIKQQGETLLASSETIEAFSAFYTQISDFHALLDSAGVVFVGYSNFLKDCKYSLDTTSFSNKEIFQKAYDDALIVFGASTSLIADFNSSLDALTNAYFAYTGGKVLVNLATKATASTSFVSSWERLSALNDGFEPANSADKTHTAYGNWSGETLGVTSWVQYDWNVVQMIKSVSVYWFADGGGVLLPTQAYIEYWDGTEWKSGGDIGFEGDKFNSVNVDFSTSKLRLSMTNGTVATGILELKVIGYETPVGITPIKQNNDISVYPTSIKRGSALNIAFSNELSKPVSVEMFMINGKKVYQTSVSEKYSTVNVPNTLSSGIYLMVLDAPEGRITRKLIVE